MSIEKNYWNTSRNKAHRENSCLVSVGNIVSYGNLNREAACKAFKIRVQLLDTVNQVILNAFQAAFSGSTFGRKILSSEIPVFLYSFGKL